MTGLGIGIALVLGCVIGLNRFALHLLNCQVPLCSLLKSLEANCYLRKLNTAQAVCAAWSVQGDAVDRHSPKGENRFGELLLGILCFEVLHRD